MQRVWAEAEQMAKIFQEQNAAQIEEMQAEYEAEIESSRETEHEIRVPVDVPIANIEWFSEPYETDS